MTIAVVPAEARPFERLSGEELPEYAGRLRGMPAAGARSRADDEEVVSWFGSSSSSSCA